MSEKPKPTFAKVAAKAIHELPTSISRELGRSIVRWSYFEHYIQKVIWALVGVDDIIGRYAVREPRITERIDMIRELAALRSIKLKSDAWFHDYWVQADAAQSRRDLLAHGLWANYPDGTLRVIRMRGQHPKNIKQIPHRSRKISPEGQSVTVAELRFVIGRIDLLIAEAVSLEKLAEEQLRALLDKSA